MRSATTSDGSCHRANRPVSARWNHFCTSGGRSPADQRSFAMRCSSRPAGRGALPRSSAAPWPRHRRPAGSPAKPVARSGSARRPGSTLAAAGWGCSGPAGRSPRSMDRGPSAPRPSSPCRCPTTCLQGRCCCVGGSCPCSPSESRSRRVDVVIDGELAARWAFVGDCWAEETRDVPVSAGTGSGRALHVRFIVHRPVSPQSIDHDVGSRQLGLSLHSLVIEPADAADLPTRHTDRRHPTLAPQRRTPWLIDSTAPSPS